MPEDARVPLALRPATLDDANSLQALLARTGEAMARAGFLNWTPAYPLDRLRADIAEREVFAVLEDSRYVATFTVGRNAVRPYLPPPWPAPDAPAFYLNRLATAPELQRRGIGAWCLAQLDALARLREVRAIRCDVLVDNAALCAFYERRGYRRRGQRTHSGWNFVCLERIVGAG